MKLPQIVDADDLGILAKGAILAAIAGAGAIFASAVFGVAWTVFKIAGGL